MIIQDELLTFPYPHNYNILKSHYSISVFSEYGLVQQINMPTLDVVRKNKIARIRACTSQTKVHCKFYNLFHGERKISLNIMLRVMVELKSTAESFSPFNHIVLSISYIEVRSRNTMHSS